VTVPGSPAKFRAVHALDAIMRRQSLVEEGVFTVDEVRDGPVFAQHGLEEQPGLGAQVVL
jgi:hypothetical protein